jgi:hypothetical protein
LRNLRDRASEFDAKVTIFAVEADTEFDRGLARGVVLQ